MPAAPRESQLEFEEVVAEEFAEDAIEEPAVQERSTPARAEPQRAPRSGTRVHHKIKAGSVLAARAATEYVYVAQDIRRIVLVTSALVTVLFVLWFLLVVAKVIPLPFY